MCNLYSSFKNTPNLFLSTSWYNSLNLPLMLLPLIPLHLISTHTHAHTHTLFLLSFSPPPVWGFSMWDATFR